MDNITTLLAISGVVVGAGGAIGFIFPSLKKRGINISNVLDRIEKGLEELKTGVQVVKEITPSTPGINVIELIEKWAEIGVKKAQQLYISSQLPADQRKQAAIDTIVTTLKQLNIPVTADLQQLINDTVESKVFDIKTDDEKKAATQNALSLQVTQLQTQNSQLQSNIAQLTQQNTVLNNKLATVQNTVATTSVQ
ncbi:MAG: hypothetical protein Q8936_08355 [Bacillota bacterium]|nr:hypothetical protein [Bacillota bacterium]